MLGPPLATPTVASGAAGLPPAPDARLWLPADLMFALRLAAGTAALVGVSSGSDAAPTPLPQLFQSKHQLSAPAPPAAAPPAAAQQPQPPQQHQPERLGSLVAVAELWPAQGVPKGASVPSPTLRDALARPEAGSRLLVYGLGEKGQGGCSPAPGAHACTQVFLRMCQRQGPGGTAVPALLLPDEAAGTDSNSSVVEQGQAASGQWPASPAPALSPAMRAKGGAPAVLSPAMRAGGAGTPVALSPAMRSSRQQPTATPPGLVRSRTGSTTPTPQGKGSSTPLAPSGSAGGSNDSSSGSSRGPATARQAHGAAKAQALLATLLASDPDARVRQMVEALLLRQLAGRRLLPGNLVALPVFGQQAVFAVEHAEWDEAAAAAAQAAAPAGRETAGVFGTPGCPPPVTASTKVHLLVGEEAVPDPSTQQQQRAQEDFPALAAAAAAGALGCALDDAAALAAQRAAAAGAASRSITFEQLGGVAKQGQALREIVALPLRSPHLFAAYNITPPRGVLLYGPPGTGKTVLACATASLAGARFFVINGPEVVSEYFGESEAGLRGIFAAAAALAPSVIFIDELDAVAPSRDGGPGGGGKGSSGGGSSARVVSTLLTELDGLGAAPVVLVAATNRPDSLDPALRRPGRFDREIEVGVPPPHERRDILMKQLRGMAHSLTPEQVAELADGAHGFVAADLAALCNEAAMTALRRVVAARSSGGGGGGSSDSSSGSSALCITLEDFEAAETRTRPSAMRELAFEIPKVSWDDIGGMDDVKQRLKEAVELPFKNPEALQRLGVVPPRGVLLHGPPGCSKTLLARAVASQAKLNFISVKGPELYSKYVGESEKALASLFSKARTSSPSVIFFDEIDGLVSVRDESGDQGVGVGERMLSQLLQEMDGLQARTGVIVIAATNRPDCLDPALLRPGRFDRMLKVPLPDCAARAAIFAVHTRAMPLAADVSLDALAQQTDRFSGAAIAACCREAALNALEDDINATCVAMQHFLSALEVGRRRL